MIAEYAKIDTGDGLTRQKQIVNATTGSAQADMIVKTGSDGLIDASFIAGGGGPAPTQNAIFPIVEAAPGAAFFGGNAQLVTGIDLGVVQGGGGVHLYQLEAIAAKISATITIPIFLRAGQAKLLPTGKIDGVALSNPRTFGNSTGVQVGATSVPDWLYDAVVNVPSTAGSTTLTFTHDDGGTSTLTLNAIASPEIANITSNNSPAGGLTAWKPGDTINMTVTLVAGALMDTLFINGASAHTDTAANAFTFDWVVPAVGLQGYNATYGFTAKAQYFGVQGSNFNLPLPIETAYISSLSGLTQTYPTNQLAIKATEQVTLAGTINFPSSGSYTFSAQAPAGMTVISESYGTPSAGAVTYSVVLQRSTAAQGYPTLSFTATSTRSAAVYTGGSQTFEVQLNAPTLSIGYNRVRFGTGTNTVTVVSNLRLFTPPTITNFTYASEALVSGNWVYSYTRTNVTVPASGETVGSSGANALAITSNAVGGSGMTTSTVTGTYALYGWFGTFHFAFTTPYSRIINLTSLEQQALVSAGTINAVSNGSDTPTWFTCDVSGTAASVPGAGYITMSNGGQNASGNLTLDLTTP